MKNRRGSALRTAIALCCMILSGTAHACFQGPSSHIKNISLATSIFAGEFISFSSQHPYTEIEVELIEPIHGRALEGSFTIYHNRSGHFSAPSKQLVKGKYIVAVTSVTDIKEHSPIWAESIGGVPADAEPLWVIQEFCSIPFILKYSKKNKNAVYELIKDDIEFKKRLSDD